MKKKKWDSCTESKTGGGGQEMSIEPPIQIQDKREGMEQFSGKVAVPLPPSVEDKENRPAPRCLGLLPGLQRLVEGSAIPLGMGGGAPMLRVPQEFLSEEVSPVRTATLPLIARGQWLDQGTLLPDAPLPPSLPMFLSIPSRVKENREVQSRPKEEIQFESPRGSRGVHVPMGLGKTEGNLLPTK